MSMVQSSMYNTKLVDSLVYHTKPDLIDSIEQRRCDRWHVEAKSSDYKAGDTLTATFSSDQCLDLQTLSLNFKINTYIANGTEQTDGVASATAVGALIVSAGDVVKKMTVYYNDVLVEEVDNCAKFTNAFLYSSASKQWFSTEGNALIGFNPWRLSKAINSNSTSTDYVTNPAYSYCPTVNGCYFSVPLCLYSGFCRNQFITPLFGSKLRIQVVLGSNIEVLTRPRVAGDFYKLNDVSLLCDTIVLSPSYRQSLINQIKSEEGIRIPFTSMITNQSAFNGTGTNYFRISFNLVNALSLVMLKSPEASKIDTTLAYRFANHGFPITDFVKLDVSVGSERVTPSDGIKDIATLYRSSELCVNSLCNLQSSGIIDRPTLTATYTQDTTETNAKAGCVLMGVSFDKTTENDDNLLNQGISSSSGKNEVNITLQTTASASTDVLYSAIIHKRALKVSSAGVICDF